MRDAVQGFFKHYNSDIKKNKKEINKTYKMRILNQN